MATSHHAPSVAGLAGWLALVALVVFSWEVMNRDTIWAFVADAPRQAGDLLARAWPPRWSYLDRLWKPLGDTINMATLGTLLGIVAMPIAFLAAGNTTPSAIFSPVGGASSLTDLGDRLRRRHPALP